VLSEQLGGADLTLTVICRVTGHDPELPLAIKVKVRSLVKVNAWLPTGRTGTPSNTTWAASTTFQLIVTVSPELISTEDGLKSKILGHRITGSVTVTTIAGVDARHPPDPEATAL
jgi:hypothetical protein